MPPTTPTVSAPVVLPGAPAPLPHLGRPFDIAGPESLLTVLVYRGGALASAGHNHVIASHTLHGTLYVPARLADTSFEIHLPIAELAVDEPELRAQQPGTDFAAEVPDCILTSPDSASRSRHWDRPASARAGFRTRSWCPRG